MHPDSFFSGRRPITFLTALLLALALPAAGQTPPALPAGPLTLAQVLEAAESRSETIAAARAGIARAEGEHVRARSGLYPQVSAALIYERALASEFEGLFDDFGDDGGDGPAIDLPFGRENTWRLSLALTQNLYSGGRLGAQQAVAAAGRTVADIGLTTARGQLLFDVTQAYYDVALSDRLVAIAEATLKQADATVRQVDAGFAAGMQPEFELLRARVNRDAQTPALIRQRANRELAVIRLKQLLDLPLNYDLQLAVSPDEAALPPAAFAARLAGVEDLVKRSEPVASVLALAPEEPDRAPVQEATSIVNLREAALDAARAERMPRISFLSTYGRVGYPIGVAPQLDRTNWIVGATVTVPILTGGQLRANEAIARADLDQSRAQLQQVRELAAVDTRSAWAELVAARATWEATAGTVEQAVRAHEIAEVRYREGVSTQLELSDARLLLQQAEANRALAARDLQVARARVALLPDLPIGAGATPAQRQQTVPPPTTPAPPPPSGAAPLIRAATAGGQGQVAGNPIGGQR